MPSSAAPSHPPTYTFSLHDALPISRLSTMRDAAFRPSTKRSMARHSMLANSVPITWSAPTLSAFSGFVTASPATLCRPLVTRLNTKDRKSTRLNSSHLGISYAVFCCSLPPPDLHFFPTRRSSDLQAVHDARRCVPALDQKVDGAAFDVGELGADYLECADAQRFFWIRDRLTRDALQTAGNQVEHQRSEEHTSELQSLRHLVCRLLLLPPTPRLTLFPYTTLFRSPGCPRCATLRSGPRPKGRWRGIRCWRTRCRLPGVRRRSALFLDS